MDYPIWAWVAFTVGVIFMLLLDLQVFHREAHEVRVREAAAWSLVWIAAGVLFGWFVWWERGSQAGLEYFTAYLIEKSLSLDNVFVWMVVFGYFAVAPRYQHRVLFWGVVGAIVMRGIFIAAGVSLLKAFHWVVYVFGAILVITGLRLAFRGEEEVLPEHNPVLRMVRRLIPMTETYEGQAFFVRRAGRLMATPMLAVLVVVETTDLMFAVDSVPAVLAITREPFIVWTSNVAAILGLRALYFLIAGVLRQFRYLHYGLAVVLIYVGGKMAASEFYKIPTPISLGVIAAIVGTAIVLSVVAEIRERAQAAQPVNPGPTHSHGQEG